MFKKVSSFVSAVAVTSVLTAGSALAAIDTAAIDETKGDVATVGAAIIAIFVAIAGFKYIRKIF